MKAILIDAENETVQEVSVRPNELDDIYAHLKCGMFECPFSLPNGDTLYVDEEALIKDSPPKFWFQFEGAPQPYAGNGLFIGSTNTGASRDAKISVEDVKSKVKFFNHEEIVRQVRHGKFSH